MNYKLCNKLYFEIITTYNRNEKNNNNNGGLNDLPEQF